MKRPSHKEIYQKITQAGKTVAKGKLAVINAPAVAADALELGYDIEELADVLLDLLRVVRPHDYVGTSPPQTSYEGEIFQMDLYAFKCNCPRFGQEVYFKFTMKNDTFWLVSLHLDRPEKR